MPSKGYSWSDAPRLAAPDPAPGLPRWEALAIDAVADLAGLGSAESLRRHFRAHGLDAVTGDHRDPGGVVSAVLELFEAGEAGAIAPLAGPLFNEYLLAFEVTSVLLLAAVVGAVVLGKRKEREHAR